MRSEVLASIYDERGPLCQARTEVCTAVAADGHEILTRARGGIIVDPDNIILVCRACHEWIHGHPEAATRAGLLASSSAADGGNDG